MPDAPCLPPARPLPHVHPHGLEGPVPPTETEPKTETAPAPEPAKHPAAVLAESLVRLGDGSRRRCVLTHRERAAMVFRTAGLALAGVVLGLPLALPALLVQGGLALMARLCRAVAGERGAGKTGLALPLEQALLHQRAGGVDPGALEVLHAYAAKLKTPLSPEEITQLVHAGQNLMLALREPLRPGADPHVVEIEGHAVRCNALLARALTWYLMAVAAAQETAALADGERMEPQGWGAPPPDVSDMVTNGTLLMRDPDQRIYRFLRGSVQSHPRPSTHFASKSASAERFQWLGLFAGASPRQYGIEDMGGRFPGGGGALLFDTLRDPGAAASQLFVKFEKAGWPTLLPRDEAGGLQRVAYSIQALHRHLAHLTNFVTTRFDSKDGGRRVERMEHVHKGSLKPLIYEPFVALVEDAIRAGLIAAEYRSILSGVETHGLPFVAATVEALHGIACATADQCEPGNARVALLHADARRLERAVLDFSARFDQVMDRFGVTLPDVERRGAEVHLDLDAALSRVDRSPTPGAGTRADMVVWHPLVRLDAAPSG